MNHPLIGYYSLAAQAGSQIRNHGFVWMFINV